MKLNHLFLEYQHLYCGTTPKKQLEDIKKSQTIIAILNPSTKEYELLVIALVIWITTLFLTQLTQLHVFSTLKNDSPIVIS